jgi:hypothetical protein
VAIAVRTIKGGIVINKASLLKIIDQVERGERLLTGEIQLLRDAVDLLDDLASTLDKIVAGSDREHGFEHETTQQLKTIDGDLAPRGRPWGDDYEDRFR